MNKTLKIILWLLFAVAIIVGGIFFRHSHVNGVGKEIQVSFVNENARFFNEKEIKSKIIKLTDSIHLKKIKDIDLKQIETALNSSAFIENVDVYFSLQRNLIVKIKEYNPMIKIMDMNQKKFYISKKGFLVPQKKGVSINLPLVYGEFKCQNTDSLTTNNICVDSLKHNQILKDIFKVYSTIEENQFVHSQINHIYINKKQEFELIPTIGKHIFLLGNTSDLDKKMTKIDVFYHQILKNNGWDKYKLVNLKYNHQIVCKKSL